VALPPPPPPSVAFCDRDWAPLSSPLVARIAFARARARALYLYAIDRSIRAVIEMFLLLMDKREILDLTIEQLQYVPKIVLLRDLRRAALGQIVQSSESGCCRSAELSRVSETL